MRHVLLSLAFLLALTGTARAATLPTDFSDETIVSGLSSPTGMTLLPDGRVLVAEKNTGRLRVVTLAGAVNTIFTMGNLFTDSESGLLDVAVDPGWPTDPYVYLFHTRNSPRNIVISRYNVSGSLSDPDSTNLSLSNPYLIIDDAPLDRSTHNGGTLRFGIDDMLYVSIGDDRDPCSAQDSTSLKGVILRLNVIDLPNIGVNPPPRALLIAPGNPFPANGTDSDLAFAYGVRNPFRFSIDPLTGTLYIADVGENTYEELDVCTGGENFGWPIWEGPLEVDPGGCSVTSLNPVHPIYSILHNASPQSILSLPLYRGGGGTHRFPPLYDGCLFFSEAYSGVIRVLKNNGGSWSLLPAVPGQPNATDWGTGETFMVDSDQGADDAIYYVTIAGSLKRIIYTGVITGAPDPVVPARLAAFPNPVSSQASGVTIQLPADTGGTVDLFDIRGRRVASLSAAPGTSSTAWNLRDSRGGRVPPGVYLARYRGESTSTVSRLVVHQ